MQLNYLLDKINNSILLHKPFKHLYIENFFSDKDFDNIINDEQIRIPIASNDSNLIDILQNKGYGIIKFPGSITSKNKYVEWHRDKKPQDLINPCEGFGLVLRLQKFNSQGLLETIDNFLKEDAFNKCIAQKFGVALDETTRDCGIQKYLDGYEISPHADSRRKALTYMVNINTCDNSEDINYHTHYCIFKNNTKYVQDLWNSRSDIARHWVPWDWCETTKKQTHNNSIVIFSPDNDTMHAVKTDYNHLSCQRTQLYGNLWYKRKPKGIPYDWKKLKAYKESS